MYRFYAYHSTPQQYQWTAGIQVHQRHSKQRNKILGFVAEPHVGFSVQEMIQILFI